ncbi:ISAs1 family transposase [Actinomadura rugatobispora]|uniref:ISAs1 family transposase n=1 Tax=Actinomadura rugatobispora TaxID=1994 RepID=A0ABW0ZYD6_9ACTN|nr:ISAs1 family transposase [Actinomadura rugatobispora]
MVQCVTAAAEPGLAAAIVSTPVVDVCCDLLELLGGVSDGRPGQGRDHPVAAVLALAAAAVVAGMRGYTAITGWVADVPAGVLADLYMRAGAAPARPPSKSTIWRVLTDADPDAFDTAIGRWLMGGLAARTDLQDTGEQDPGETALMQIRLDGKTVRGAKKADGNQLHLPAALAGPDAQTSVIAAQAQVPDARTKEPAAARAMLGQLDLSGQVITADALHTVKATAKLICDRGGEFVLPVKENRRALVDALDALPWCQARIAHTATDRGHGRITTRTTQVLPVPDNLPFPHVSQVFLIERHVTATDGTPISAVAQLGVTSLATQQASPADLARYVQGQWAIEALHWIRDTLYREAHSTIRTRSGPRVMASLRNLAIGALRLSGRTGITEATRWAGRYMTRPFTVLGLAY